MLRIEKTLIILKRTLIDLEYPILFSQAILREFGVIPFPTIKVKVENALKSCQNLFIHAEVCDKSLIMSYIGNELTKALINHEIFHQLPNNQVRSNFKILWFLNYALLIPYRKYLKGNPIYIGADSFTLFRNIQIPNRTSKVLDLFTGSGIQLIFQSNNFEKGLGIDINLDAIKIAKYNAIMNELTGKIKFKESDVVKIEEFLNCNEFFPVDFILANPPILPAPDGVGISKQIFTYGGPDGLKLVRELCKMLPNLMKDQAEANILICSLGNDQPFFLSELNTLLPINMNYKLIGLQKIPIELEITYRPQKEQELWRTHYRELNVQYWFRLLLKVSQKFQRSEYIEIYRDGYSKQTTKEKRGINAYSRALW